MAFLWCSVGGQVLFLPASGVWLRSSLKIFDNLSKAICWIARNNYCIPHIFHLLDDFLTIDSPAADADCTMALLTMIFAKLGVPIAPHKTVGPMVTLEYLGVMLDTQKMEARLPKINSPD